MNKKKPRLKGILCVLLCGLLLLPLAPVPAFAAGRTYYVAKTGADTNDGSLSAPFASIGKAASVMRAGDTCYIREGTYYEEVNANLTGTAENPISFRAYQNETVTISGGERLTGWTQHDGNIYVTNMNWDIYGGAGNMLFADGTPCVEARWPNASVSQLLDREYYARVDSVSGMTITDSDLPAVDLTGAEVWCASGVAYWSYLSKITAHNTTAHTLTLTNVFDGSTYYPKKDNIYYITRSLALLDSPGEWYKDVENGKIYLYAPGGVNPDTISVEAKKREYAIRLTNASYVSFDGINVRGGLISFTGSANHCGFYNAAVECLDYNMGKAEKAGRTGDARGVVLGGSGNRISKCEIKNMYGEGVTVEGSGNQVINNNIHDINFEHTYSDGIYITGENHLISRNTVRRVGRGTIGGKFDACVISYNDLSDSCRLSRDGGVVYFNAHDYKNSELHHNIIHDAMDNEGMQYGLYLDSFTTSLVIYNNLIYNTEGTQVYGSSRLSFCLNPNSLNNVIINNTFINARPTPYTFAGSDLSGCVFINNLFRSKAHAKSAEELEALGIVFENNLEGSTTNFADFWANAAANDYTLAEDSAAIDAGQEIPGITDDYTGSAPDCGAFEYGVEPWTAGHDFSTTYSMENGLNVSIPYRNMIKNHGFETYASGNFDGWQKSGDPERFQLGSWSHWGAMTKDGSYSVKISQGSTLKQTISGLKPYSVYRFGGYGLLAGTFTRGYTFSKVYNKSGAETTLAKSEPQRNLGNIGALEYSVASGNKRYDKLMLGFQYPKAGQKVSIKLGGRTGTSIAELTLTNPPTSIGWKWFTVELSQPLTGSQTVCVCLEGDFSSTNFAGFYPDASASQDAIVLKAVSDSGMESVQTIRSRSFELPVQRSYVATGAKGEVTFEISKTGGDMYGYVDAVYLAEDPGDTGLQIEETIFVESVCIRDETGAVLPNFVPGKFNMFEISIRNNTGAQQPLDGMLALYDADNTLTDLMNISYTVASKKYGRYILGTVVPVGTKRVSLLAWDSVAQLKPVVNISNFLPADSPQ